jgi:hypothetical protein
VTLGHAPDQDDAFRSTRSFCDKRLSPTSVYRLLHDKAHLLFPDEAFADLFDEIGRCCVPPRIVAVVMALQRIEGLSDREAADHFMFDVRWKFAAGGLDFEYPGFVHTVLVDMRARLRNSKRPNRIFEAVLDVSKSAGLVGRKRVLDSTALYDAVATQDTVTMIRASIRGLLQAADEGLAAELRSVLKRDDDYGSAGKPACDWDDKAAREALVDALARDAYAVLGCLDGRELNAEVKEAASLVATVVGQDLEQREDGVFRIARRVAPDRVISTVDPEARHGHKTAARGFDGYKGHLAIDPDSEIITATAVTPGNVSDGSVAMQLLADVLPTPDSEPPSAQVEAASMSTQTQAQSSSVQVEAEPPSAQLEATSMSTQTQAQSTRVQVEAEPPSAQVEALAMSTPTQAQSTSVVAQPGEMQPHEHLVPAVRTNDRSEPRGRLGRGLRRCVLWNG